MRLVLFDLDGTLVDSAPGIHASIRAAAATLGLPEPTADQLSAMVGPPLQEGFATTFGLAGAAVDRAVAAYREHYTANGVHQAPAYRGIAAMVTALRADGTLLAVTTSKPGAFAEKILDGAGLAGCFAGVYAATLDGRIRHKEQVVGLALTAHPDGRDPVLVGDRAQDVVGARAHGLRCIGAGWGPGRPGELEQAGAAVVCATPAEVPAALAAV